MAGRIQGCDLDVVPALMGRLGSPCGTPDTLAIVISTKRSAWSARALHAYSSDSDS